MVSAQQWTEVEVLNLESCTRCAISGKKKDTVRLSIFQVSFHCKLNMALVIG